MINIIGMGLNGKQGLSEEALLKIKKAGLVIGAKRHLAIFPGLKGESLPITIGLNEAAKRLKPFAKKGAAAVLATGDPLLFGIADFIIKKFGKSSVRIFPNVSAAQEAFARTKESWNNARVISVHGRDNLDEAVDAITSSSMCAVFTDEKNNPRVIASALIERGFEAAAHVCESLGTKDEKITKGSLSKISKIKKFHPLNIMLIKNIAADKGPLPLIGLPDSLFRHDKGMITKSEIRAASISKLNLHEKSVIWDIGAGCGSVAIEAARISNKGKTYAIEKNSSRARFIEQNRKKFSVRNLDIINKEAPEALKNLPAPDAVFVGGGGKDLKDILKTVSKKLKNNGALVVNAVTVESMAIAYEFLGKPGWQREVSMLSVARLKGAGPLNLFKAQNPVFIISGVKN